MSYRGQVVQRERHHLRGKERGCDEGAYPWGRAYRVLVRLLPARNGGERALRLLEGPLGDSPNDTPRGRTFEVRILQANDGDADDDDHRVVATALAEVFAASTRDGYLNEGLPIAHGARNASPGEWERAGGDEMPVSRPGSALLAVANRADCGVSLDGRALRAVVPSVVEPLTERELEVLALLASGKRNREIADELVVTLDTVKKHVTHILDKLEATNRTQAVAHGRELRLLE